MPRPDLSAEITALLTEASAHGLSVTVPDAPDRFWLRRQQERLDARRHQQALAASGIDISTLPRLIVWEGQPHERTFPLPDEPVTLGRGADCAVRLWNDSKVSRRHCRVFQHGGQFVVEDRMSAGGTRVGDTHYITRHTLRDGETIWIGETPVRFRLPR